MLFNLLLSYLWPCALRMGQVNSGIWEGHPGARAWAEEPRDFRGFLNIAKRQRGFFNVKKNPKRQMGCFNVKNPEELTDFGSVPL